MGREWQQEFLDSFWRNAVISCTLRRPTLFQEMCGGGQKPQRRGDDLSFIVVIAMKQENNGIHDYVDYQ